MKEVVACPKCTEVILKSRHTGIKLIERLVVISRRVFKIKDQIVCDHKLIKRLVKIATENPNLISVEWVHCPECAPKAEAELITC